MSFFKNFEILYPGAKVEIQTITTKENTKNFIVVDRKIVYEVVNNAKDENESCIVNIQNFLITEYKKRILQSIKEAVEIYCKIEFGSTIDQTKTHLICKSLHDEKVLHTITSNVGPELGMHFMILEKYYEKLLIENKLKKYNELQDKLTKIKGVKSCLETLGNSNHTKFYIYNDEKILFDYLCTPDKNGLDNEIDAMEQYLNRDKKYYYIERFVTSDYNMAVVSQLIEDLEVQGVINSYGNIFYMKDDKVVMEKLYKKWTRSSTNKNFVYLDC